MKQGERKTPYFKLLFWLFPFAVVASIQAAPLQMSYSGRLLQAGNGLPIAGPVAISLRFFDAPTAGNQLGSDKDFPEVVLQQGVFQVVLSFVSTELGVIFSDSKETWIQVTDLTHGIDYERQKFSSVPYAFQVPVDNKTLKFSEETGKLFVHELTHLSLSNGTGKVKLAPHESAAGSMTYVLPKADGARGEVLSTQGNGQLQWVDPNAEGDPLDSNADQIADQAADTNKLNGQSEDYYLNLDHMISGSANKVFTAAEKAKLAAIDPNNNVNSTTVEAAGAVMKSDLSTAGLIRTDGSGGVSVDATSYLSSEDDPEVGGIDHPAGSYCVSDGDKINCDQSSPLYSSDLGTGANKILQLNNIGAMPALDGSELTGLDLTAPGAIGSTTPNSATFSTTTTRGLRLQDSGGDGATNYMTIQAPDLSDNATVYTMPASPSNGEYLTSDASGNLSWANPSTTLNVDNIDSGTITDAMVPASIARDLQLAFTSESDLTTALDDNYQALDADLTELSTGTLSGAKIGTGIDAATIDNGTVGAGVIDASIARDSDNAYTTKAALTTELADVYQPLNTHLTDLADGTLTGSKIGSGIRGDFITSGTVDEQFIHTDIARDTDNTYKVVGDLTSDLDGVYQPLDADLSDLADGVLTSSKVGSGIDTNLITTGTVDEAYIDSSIARDSENTYPNFTALKSELDDQYQPASEHLTDLASDGVLPGSKIESGVSGNSVTEEILAVAQVDTTVIALDSDIAYTSTLDLTSALDTVYQGKNTHLDDLADGELAGSKVGEGILAQYITTGTFDNDRLPASLSTTTLVASGTVTATRLVLTCPTVSGVTIVRVHDQDNNPVGCIETGVRAADQWNDAIDNCRADGGRLPTLNEFFQARKEDSDGDISLSGMGNYQWTGDYNLATETGSYSVTFTPPPFPSDLTTSYKYRCWYDWL